MAKNTYSFTAIATALVKRVGFALTEGNTHLVARIPMTQVLKAVGEAYTTKQGVGHRKTALLAEVGGYTAERVMDLKHPVTGEEGEVLVEMQVLWKPKAPAAVAASKAGEASGAW
jgi:hypothetical protein